MKRIYMIAALVAALAALTACNRSGMDEARNLIRIGSMDMSGTNAATRADDTPVNRALQPMFLFWTEGNFNSATASAPDFFVRTPDGEIDTYKTSPFGTQVYYPIQNKTIYATGFAPAPGDGYLSFATEGDYSKFIIPARPAGSVPADAYGVMDILSAPRISATDSNPFTVANPLQFSHAQTKLSFDATIPRHMPKYVRYVQIKLPAQYVPQSVEWNETSQRYEVRGGTGEDVLLLNYWTDGEGVLSTDPRANETMRNQLSYTKKEDMGYTYIVPPGNYLQFKVVFKITDTADGFEYNKGIKDVEVPVEVRLDATLEAGDAYLIHLSIDTHDIELAAQKVDWEKGGTYYVSVPIVPVS